MRGIGGVKIQLDICCAKTEVATESVCQMVTAVSQRKGLSDKARSKGPLREERAAREEGHEKGVEGLRNDLEKKREKESQEERESKKLLESLNRGGFVTQIRWGRRDPGSYEQTFYEMSRDDEGGTHRADTVSVERKRKRKKKMGIVDIGPEKKWMFLKYAATLHRKIWRSRSALQALSNSRVTSKKISATSMFCATVPVHHILPSQQSICR